MPVPTQVGGFGRHDDDMTNAYLDDAVATRAHIALACLIRLDRLDEFGSERCAGIVECPGGVGHAGSIGTRAGSGTITA